MNNKELNLPEWAKAIKERLDKATPGPWSYFYKAKYNEHHVSVPFTDSNMRAALFPDGCPTGEFDAAFIGSAPTDIQVLLQTLSDYREALEFYENPKTYEASITEECGCCIYGKTPDILEDRGVRALKALQYYPTQKKEGE